MPAMRVEDDEKGPERTCVATRVVRPIAELIRFAVGPGDVLTPDIRAKLPGRGVWVTCSRPVLEEAIRRNAFARSLKRPVVAPEGMGDLVERLLTDDARQFLALANKAGLVVSGFAKVEAALASGKAVAVVSASDAAEDGKRKLRQAARRHAGDAAPPRAVSPLPGREMDLALARENAIHAALLAGQASDAFLARCARLEQFRAGEPRGTRPDADGNSASTGPFALDHE
jgi:predicted RNA-binding protein YlxR (DUF448 family)